MMARFRATGAFVIGDRKYPCKSASNLDPTAIDH